jgi:hypothetical protein
MVGHYFQRTTLGQFVDRNPDHGGAETMVSPKCVHKLTPHPLTAWMFGHVVEQCLLCRAHATLQVKKNLVDFRLLTRHR